MILRVRLTLEHCPDDDLAAWFAAMKDVQYEWWRDCEFEVKPERGDDFYYLAHRASGVTPADVGIIKHELNGKCWVDVSAEAPLSALGEILRGLKRYGWKPE